MAYQEDGTPRNGKEAKDIGDAQFIGMKLLYDWRAFDPKEYLKNPAVHNTGTSLAWQGIKPGFKPFERVGKYTERYYLDFQRIPDIHLTTHDGAIIVNFHQPVFVTEITSVPVTSETETRGRYLPWRKNRVVRTELREEREVIRGLMFDDLFDEAGNPEPLVVNEMKILLPVDFFREIQADVSYDPYINKYLDVLFFTMQSKDEQLRQMPVSEQVTFFTGLLTDLLSEKRNVSPEKIDEFSKLLQKSPLLTYDFNHNMLTAISTS